MQLLIIFMECYQRVTPIAKRLAILRSVANMAKPNSTMASFS